MAILTKIIFEGRRRRYVVRWLDPLTGAWRQKAVGRRRRDAEAVRDEIEQQLESANLMRDLAWRDFRTRYTELHLSSLSRSSQDGFVTAANHLEAITPIETVTDITAATLSNFSSKLRQQGRPDTSIAAYLRSLRAALNWAVQQGIIANAPHVTMPRRAKGVSGHARSRPIQLEEFERVLLSVPKIRPDDAPIWDRFLKGLWESGFRIEELLKLSWQPHTGWWLDDSGEIPIVKISADAQKSGQDQFQPITREFWQLLDEQEDRTGYCFPMPGKDGGQMAKKTVGRIISKIGRKSGVITSPKNGKTATSHDIGRRAFATRAGGKLTPNELAAWMRHASPETTAKYYYAPSVTQLAHKLWDEGGAQGGATSE